MWNFWSKRKQPTTLSDAAVEHARYGLAGPPVPPKREVPCLNCDPNATMGYSWCEKCRPPALARTLTDNPTQVNIFPEALALMELRHELEDKLLAHSRLTACLISREEMERWVQELRKTELRLYR